MRPLAARAMDRSDTPPGSGPGSGLAGRLAGSSLSQGSIVTCAFPIICPAVCRADAVGRAELYHSADGRKDAPDGLPAPFRDMTPKLGRFCVQHKIGSV